MRKNVVAKILILIIILSISIYALITIPHKIKINNISDIFSTVLPTKKIKVLVVPGHEPNAGGADEFKTIKERDLNLQLSEILKNDLSQNSNIEVILARDENGWNKDLENYVMTSSTTIMNWVLDMKNEMMSKVDAGIFKLINPDMKHNNATSDAVLYLYGTNKWIALNNIDLVLHVHFNSNPKINGKPNFSGYCMYVPEKQYGNASSSRIFANYINEEISKIENKSTMPQEKDTIIEDQELIATGNYDTLKIPSVVVEYAYIYEPMMLSSSTRNIFINRAASSTAKAIENYIQNQF